MMGQRKLDYHDSLVERLRQNDRGAQYEIYKLYNVAMFNTAHRIVGNQSEAEDVLQDAFLAAFLQIEKFKGDSTFGAWLKRIVINKSINALNKRKVDIVSIEEKHENIGVYDTDDNSPVTWNVNQIMKAVDELPDGYRVVLSLYLLEGYDHREIANILDITEGGSKSQFNRAKKKLREILTTQPYV